MTNFGVVHEAATASSGRPTPLPRAEGATTSTATKPCAQNVYCPTQ
ncbi:hypothetical protein OG323_37620 (plasmid) [Streptomyces cyaneofuscatus]|nr:hypothetical protein OG323_37620 [Streptomyces cyaneofuscatus]